MMIQQLNIKALVGTKEGTINVGINADITREACLSIMLEVVKAQPGITVYVPICVVDGNGVSRAVELQSTIDTLVGNGIAYENIVTPVDKASSDNQETAFEGLIEMLNKSAETIVTKGGSAYITKIMNVPDSEVYGAMLTALEDIKESAVKKVLSRFRKPDMKKAQIAIDIDKVEKDLASATTTVLEASTDKVTVMAKIKAFAVLVFKKVVALLKGILSFTFDATTILGAAVGRVTYHTARELVYAGKAIGQAFNKDIIQSVRTA